MQRILIVRTSAIGDIVFAAALAAAIRRAHPCAHIAWLLEAGLEGLLSADPAIDRIHVWPRRHWQALWRARRFGALARAVADLRRELSSQRFDTVLDLQGLLKSAVLARLSGAPRRVGLGGFEGGRWLMSEVLSRGGEDGRISSEYAHLAQYLGLDAGSFVPRLHAPPHAVVRARSMLDEAGVPTGRCAVFAPFTTRPQKHWFEGRWRALAHAVHDELGLMPVVLGGPADAAAAARICEGTPAVALAGRTDLTDAMALVGEAALVVGVDTGLTHAGVGFARPTVALFGSTCPYRDAGRANVRVIWLGLACSPCRRRPSCDGQYDCLAAIDCARVMAEARAALAEPSSDPISPRPASPRAVSIRPSRWSSTCPPFA